MTFPGNSKFFNRFKRKRSRTQNKNLAKATGLINKQVDLKKSKRRQISKLKSDIRFLNKSIVRGSRNVKKIKSRGF